jgi:ubiquinone/menaquinone biosynthesis C-methylase UbiE
MGFYGERILPHLIKLAMRNTQFAPYRERVVSAAAGRVLEIGVGAGENQSRYGPAVSELVGLEPSARLAAMARRAAEHSLIKTTIVESTAEKMRLDPASFDTVVMTWTLCSIPDPGVALREIRHVLKRDGRLLFVEHGLALDERVRRWQHRLTPVWRRIAGGCHLDREMSTLIANAGFRIERLATGYMSGPRPMTFMYEGWARLE